MRRSLTLTEILVSAFIVATIFAAVIAVFINIRGFTGGFEKNYNANLLAESNLNNLWLSVKEDTWDSGDLSEGTHDLGSVTIGGTTYDLSYEVSTSGDYRKVDFKVSW